MFRYIVRTKIHESSVFGAKPLCSMTFCEISHVCRKFVVFAESLSKISLVDEFCILSKVVGLFSFNSY